MKKIYLILVIIFSLAFTNESRCIGQTLNILSAGITGPILTDSLTGNGVQVSNVVLNCKAGASGLFNSNGLPKLSFSNGIVLTTGLAANVKGTTGGFFTASASTANNTPGDADLTALAVQLTSNAAAVTNDACVLEFDFKPSGDTVRFDYIFGSEEYQGGFAEASNVCSQFTDVFAFFVTGNNPLGGTYNNQNIALIPGTNTPVAINTVNDGVQGASPSVPSCFFNNTQYYVNNTPSNFMTYNGLTTPFNIALPVVRCNSYHMKIAIADVGDKILDSGVFLRGFRSSSASVKSFTNVLADTINIWEDSLCSSGGFRFKLDTFASSVSQFRFDIKGTATNGTDYLLMQDTVIFPARTQYRDKNVKPLKDLIKEGTESIKIYMKDSCSGTYYDSAYVFIRDSLEAYAGRDTALCRGLPLTLNGNVATNWPYPNDISYRWSPAAYVSNPAIKNPTLVTTAGTPDTVQLFFIAQFKTCTSDTDTVRIILGKPRFSANAGPDDTICKNSASPIDLTVVDTAGTGKFKYQWTPATGLSSATVQDPVASPQVTTTYSVVVTDTAGGCQRTDTLKILVDGEGVPIKVTATPSVLCPGDLLNLKAIIEPISCGIDASAMVGSDTASYQVGTGTASQSGTPFQSPAIYSNASPSMRNQYLYRASELKNVLGNGGRIERVSFIIKQYNGNNSLQDFTIRMACTSDSVLNTFNNAGLQTVFGPVTYAPISNANVHKLTNLFNWDGVSNLIIDVCWNGPNCCGPGNKAAMTPTTYNSVVYSAGNTDQCGLTGGTASTERPNVILNVRKLQITKGKWTPSTGPNAVANDTALITTARPVTSQVYTIDISNGTCNSSASASVTIDTSLKVNAGKDTALCSSAPVQLNAAVTGNLGPVTYLWAPATGLSSTTIANPVATPAATTDYVIKVTSNGCTKWDTVRVSIGGLTFTKVSVAPTCKTNGSITVSPTGGVTPYTFIWSNAAGNVASQTNLAPGKYVFTVTDVNNCNGKDSVTLVNDSVLTLQPAVIAHVKCNAQTNGTIILKPSMNADSLTYTWFPAQPNNDSISNLAAGTYNVTVTSLNCSATGSYTITQPQPLAVALQNKTDVSCNGGNDGAINLNVTGGTTAYSYTWNPANVNSGSLVGLSANTYNVTVTDANGCTATGTYVINQPAALALGAPSVVNVRCKGGNDGFVAVFPSGGTTPYSYSWSPAAVNNDTLQNISANTYNLTVTDAKGCTTTQSATVTEPATGILFDPFIIKNVSCFGGNDGEATAGATSGQAPYQYVWSNAQNTPKATALAAGKYKITVTDAALCTAIDSVTITQPLQVTVTAVITDAKCFGASDGAVNITAAGGTTNGGPYTYSWGNAAVTEDLLNVAAGTYPVTVTDALGCTGTGSFVVNEPARLVISTTGNITDISCFGGTDGIAGTSATGGTPAYTYRWSNAFTGNPATGLGKGNIGVTVTDNNGCRDSATYVINEPAQLVFDSVSVVNILCNGAATGSITLYNSGGTPAYAYAWSVAGTAAAQTGLVATNYTATVTDARGCTADTSITLKEPTAVQVTTAIVKQILCNGASDGIAVATASGGVGPYTYAWDSPSARDTATNLLANLNYTVTATDANGCTARAIAALTEPSSLQANPTSTGVRCFGGSDGAADINPSGATPPYTFVWADATTAQTISQQLAGTYPFTITDANGCTLASSVVIGQPAVLAVSATSVDETCVGNADGKIVIRPVGGTTPYAYSYSRDAVNYFNAASDTIRNVSPASYQVLVTDINNCTATTLVNVGAPAVDVFDFTTDSTSCFGSEYSDGAITVIGLTVSNQPYLYRIDNSSSLVPDGQFDALQAGVHSIYVINNFGCDTTFDVEVYEPLPATVDIYPNDSTVDFGQSLQLHTAFQPYPVSDIVSYNWSPSKGLSCVDCPNPVVSVFDRENNYELTVIYNGGCIARSNATVFVDGKRELFVPNIFSPNGDGANDVFAVYGFGIRDFDLKIFNRWGEKVFETTTQGVGWDGTFKGKLLNPEVYTYLLDIVYLDGKKTMQTGTVTMVR
jgi:gliding motility-associated-like protein